MTKLDKIYFDIDGVLRNVASPKEDVVALLRYCLEKYPASLYWLTTHCHGGVNRAVLALENEFSSDLLQEISKNFWPTDWDALKTDGIDFDSNFVWFDDNLFWSEKAVLEEKGAMNSFFRMNPKDPEMAKKALDFLKKFE